MPINFRQLEVFCAVAETRSFTRASHVLFISQSTVSQHIRDLEESLNVKLFHRNRRNVSLTPAGEGLVERGQQIFQMLEEAETDVRTAKDPYSGKLSFGCASTTLLYRLPDILADYAPLSAASFASDEPRWRCECGGYLLPETQGMF